MKDNLILILKNSNGKDICNRLDYKLCKGLNCKTCPFCNNENLQQLIDELEQKESK